MLFSLSLPHFKIHVFITGPPKLGTDYEFTTSSGYPHNTYHGQTRHYRPSLNLDGASQTKYCDQPWNSNNNPSASSQLPTPRKLSTTSCESDNFSSNFDNFPIECLDDKTPTYPSTTYAYDNPGSQISSDFAHVPARSSQRGKFGHRRTPSNVSNASNASSNINPSFHSDEADDFVEPTHLLKYSANPPAYHRRKSQDRAPERPSTLDLPGHGSRLPPLPKKSALGRTSPKQWTAFSNCPSPSRTTPTDTPSDESSGSTSASRVRFSIDETGGYVNRAARAEEEKTLLDLPVDGQSQDGTVPLSVTMKRGLKQRQIVTRNWERGYLA